MGLNTGDATDDLILARRERVAGLRLRGLTQRAIVAQLAADGLLNPDTAAPYSLGTVHADLTALRREWAAAGRQKTAAHRAEVLAKLQEAYRAAWEGAANAAVVAALLERTHDDDPQVRAEAVRSLGRVGLPDLDNVLKALDQEARLYGLPGPVKVAQTDPDGKPVPAVVTIYLPANGRDGDPPPSGAPGSVS